MARKDLSLVVIALIVVAVVGLAVLLLVPPRPAGGQADLSAPRPPVTIRG
jgi:hypothetical protein